MTIVHVKLRHTGVHSHIRMKAKIGGQAKERQQPTAGAGNKEDTAPWTLVGAWPCQHLDFGLLASRTIRGL